MSPGRYTNRENFRKCQRTIIFLLLLFLESTETGVFFKLSNQSGAAHSQPGEPVLVQRRDRLFAMISSVHKISAHRETNGSWNFEINQNDDCGKIGENRQP
ncbi:MAG: hypothetical protein JO266_11860 [Acidobacteria bacterium]|nr:hypothetical protein [Acidobacteriota bacterium]